MEKTQISSLYKICDKELSPGEMTYEQYYTSVLNMISDMTETVRQTKNTEEKSKIVELRKRLANATREFAKSDLMIFDDRQRRNPVKPVNSAGRDLTLPGLEKLQGWMENYGTSEDGFELKPDDSSWAMRIASLILKEGGGVPVEFDLTDAGRPALYYSDIHVILCDLSVLVTFPGGKSLQFSKNMSAMDIRTILQNK